MELPVHIKIKGTEEEMHINYFKLYEDFTSQREIYRSKNIHLITYTISIKHINTEYREIFARFTFTLSPSLSADEFKTGRIPKSHLS